MYSMLKDYALSDYDQRGSRGGSAGGVVDSLHKEVMDSGRFNHNKSNRGGREKREPATILGVIMLLMVPPLSE